jgi:hypothetical protein
MSRTIMAKRSPLDDPRTATYAWARYKRLMRWMFGFTMVVVIATLGFFYWQNGMVSIHFFIATALGIGFAMLLMSALMGLVFLSSGTGHDESVSDLGDHQGSDGGGDGRSR